mmetsp:Transcript_21414/g.73795  ORF Transcript_21414/g.73795 Transcript_21414/m.73795 type:complete len:204 (+) Transcript_21414:1929-2540(+)
MCFQQGLASEGSPLLRLVLDRPRAQSILQRRQRLLDGVAARRHRRDQRRLRAAAQRLLQKPSQLRVAVRDVLRLAVDQRRDDVAQRRQGEVDLRRLLEAVARGACLGLALATCQVDEVQLAHGDVLAALLVAAVRALDDNGEDGVGPRRAGVHQRRADAAVLLARLHDLVDLVRRFDDERGELLDVDARVDVLLELELVLWVL